MTAVLYRKTMTHQPNTQRERTERRAIPLEAAGDSCSSDGPADDWFRALFSDGRSTLYAYDITE